MNLDELKVSRHIRFRQHPTMTACWVWLGYINPNTGLAIGRGTTARRAVWHKLRGRLSEDETLRSTCGEGDCVNPNHMRKLRIKARSEMSA